MLYEIYRPDNKALTPMLLVNASVQDVISAIVKPGGDHVLVKMNSSGGRIEFLLSCKEMKTVIFHTKDCKEWRLCIIYST